jgi:hypothetical protein
MKARLWLLTAFLFTPGCCWLSARPPSPPPPCSHYHAPGYTAALGPRILLLPLANETCFPQAGDQVRDALAAELQSIGCLEVVVPPCDADAYISQAVHVQGRFDEAGMLALARTFRVDTVLLGTLTDYQPYMPQRIGLSLRLVSPPAAAVIASVDGLWDARDKQLADQVCAAGSGLSDALSASFKNDLLLASPQQFQRYVCHQAVQVLIAPTPAAASAGPGQANSQTSAGSPRPAGPATAVSAEVPAQKEDRTQPVLEDSQSTGLSQTADSDRGGFFRWLRR